MPEKVKPLTAGWMLVFIYAFGLAGLIVPQTKPIFQKLIWGNLLLTAIILFCYHKKWTREFGLAILLVALCGYLIEVIGVRTGYIFGYYQYGPSLGYMIWDTPLMMGLNWAVTIYITRHIAEMIAKDHFLISVLGASLMILLDYFLEPFAINNAMWMWNSRVVPLHNYIGWFVCGIVIHYLFLKAIKYPPNKLALPLYLIQLGFFIGLYLIAYH